MSMEVTSESIAWELLCENRRLRAEIDALRAKLVAMMLDKHYVDDGERYVEWIFPGAASLNVGMVGGAE